MRFCLASTDMHSSSSLIRAMIQFTIMVAFRLAFSAFYYAYTFYHGCRNVDTRTRAYVYCVSRVLNAVHSLYDIK